ncbi:MAG: MlaD family protein, partial [Gemmatimonadota bacterium]
MIQNTDERRVRRGYAILGGLLLAAVLVFNLDAILDRARGSIDVVALVSETSGVRVGSPVWIAGTRAGHVTGIGFAGDGDSALIAIDVRLEDRFRPLLGESATAFTTKRRLIGQPMVRIETGADRSRPLEDGDTVGAATRADLDALLARGEAFPPALDSLQSALREVQARVQARRPQLVALTDRIASTTEAA